MNYLSAFDCLNYSGRNNDWFSLSMKNIDHLPADEQQHFILCDCGIYVDMRELSDVFRHLHVKNIPEAEWSHSVRNGEPAAYPKKGSRVHLN